MAGCGDVTSLESLQIQYKHQIFEIECITGRVGGTGDNIDYATNQVTGQTQKTLPAILRDAGFRPAPFTFETGGTLAIGDSDVVVLWPTSSGGDGQFYLWKGAYPKTIPASSSPSTTGGVSDAGWLPWGDITLRNELSSSGGSGLIGRGSVTVDDALNYQKFFSVPEEFPSLIGANNSPAIQAAINSTEKSTLLRKFYDVSDQISTANKESLVGQGNGTGLTWTGGNGSPGESVLRVATADPSINALNGVLVKDFIVDMSLATGLTGVDMLYASVQSELDGIQVTQVGSGSVGFRVGKEWYARIRKCSVRNAGRTGTGVLVDTTVGQVNSVPLDVQINGSDVGFDLDTSGNYIYNLELPATAHAENCAIGLRVKSGYGVRSGVIRGYFENNAVDVIWGTPGSTPLDRTQTIVWLGASFNASGSIVKLYEGNHVFIGCDRIVTLEVHENASVEILCSGVNNIINTTGDPNRVRNRPNPLTVLATGTYGNTALLPGREYNEAQTGSSTTAVFNAVSKIFSASTPANGRSARCVVTARRTYENTVKFLNFVLIQSSAGTWAYTLTGGVADVNWSIAVNSTTGAVTVTDNRADTKVYTFTASPM